MGPVCACGCGEYLPEGSTRNYKRGHKNRAMDEPKPKDDFFSNSEELDNGAPVFSIFHAAESTPNDPDPADMVEANAFSVPIKITASVRKDIEGKLGFMFAMTGNMLQLADPVCGGAILEASPKMAKALMPILCQSPSVVKWFRSSTNYMMYINFLMACAPVFGAIYTHHLAGRNKTPEQPAVAYTPQFYGVSLWERLHVSVDALITSCVMASGFAAFAGSQSDTTNARQRAKWGIYLGSAGNVESR